MPLSIPPVGGGLFDSTEKGQKMYYISEKAQDRLLKCIPAAYHTDPNCRNLTRHNAKVIGLSTDDHTTFSAYLKPCNDCCVITADEMNKLWETRGVCTTDGNNAAVTKLLIKDNGPTTAATTYPYPQTVTLWTCSDGEELTDEKEALRHELGILRQRVLRSAV